MNSQRQIQTLVCKCGSVFAGCEVPECYIDKDWLKEVRKHVKTERGSVGLVNAAEFKFSLCTCKKETPIINHQTSLELDQMNAAGVKKLFGNPCER